MSFSQKYKKITYLLRGAGGLTVCAICVLGMKVLDNTVYRDSVLLFTLLLTLTVGAFIYGLSQIISASEALSKLFILAVTAKGPGSMRARPYALWKYRQEKQSQPQTSMRLAMTILGVLIMLSVIIWIVNDNFLLDNAGWFAGTTILVLFLFLVLNDHK